MSTTSVNSRQKMFGPLLDNLTKAINELDIYTPDVSIPNEVPIAELRRNRRYGMEDKLGMITLTASNGLLQWEEGVGVLAAPGAGSERRLPTELNHKIVAQYKFEKLAPSKISDFL
ncbi:MAG TPA: hypothetical protein VGO69_06725, partial [Pyrinomonadaceae bacterium]|nr:hypothetical protein [Pyrinomonadaceae bacterium]